MRSIEYALLMCALLASNLAAVGQGPPKGDLATLQGDWGLRGFECELKGSDIDPGGPQLPADLLPLLSVFAVGPDRNDSGVLLKVQGKYLTSAKALELIARPAFEVRLDAEKSPGAVDLVLRNPSGPERTILGIYKIEEGKLTLCVALGDRRPTEFKGTAGQVVLHYKRSRH